MQYFQHFSFFAFLSFGALAGCGGGSTSAVDAFVATDAGTDDAAAPVDAFVMRDAIVLDAFVPGDSGPPRTDGDVVRCDYVAVDEVIVLCGTDDYRFVSHFTSTMADCPAYYAFDLDGPFYADTASAIASDPTCSDACEWHFASEVTRLYCGHRSGYEVLHANETGCADIYRFAEGYYASVEEHDAMNPCP